MVPFENAQLALIASGVTSSIAALQMQATFAVTVLCHGFQPEIQEQQKSMEAMKESHS